MTTTQRERVMVATRVERGERSEETWVQNTKQASGVIRQTKRKMETQLTISDSLPSGKSTHKLGVKLRTMSHLMGHFVAKS